jgi:hypothetical protein
MVTVWNGRPDEERFDYNDWQLSEQGTPERKAWEAQRVIYHKAHGWFCGVLLRGRERGAVKVFGSLRGAERAAIFALRCGCSFKID